MWNNTDPTSTEFSIGTHDRVNTNGESYVAYLFAHHNNDGDFGPSANDDIINCGSYTGNNSTDGPTINLGFEPQWLLIRHTDATGNSWFIVDNMRGVVTGGNDASLSPNANNDEQTGADLVEFNASGFQLKRANDDVNGNGNTYIYMAIRRGPLNQPTASTNVFNVLKETSANLNQTPPFKQVTNFPVDVVSNKIFDASSSWWTATRLTNARVQTESTAAETGVSTTHEFDHNDGVAVNGLTGDTDFMGYHWRRAPGYFDVVAYSGTGSAQTISHNLSART